MSAYLMNGACGDSEWRACFQLFWHFHPYSTLANRTALGPVGVQRVFPGVAVKTMFTKVFVSVCCWA